MARFIVEADAVRGRTYDKKGVGLVGKLTIAGSGLSLEADCSAELVGKIPDGACRVSGDWMTIFNSFEKTMKHELVISGFGPIAK